jgi:hypothetical protein
LAQHNKLKPPFGGFFVSNKTASSFQKQINGVLATKPIDQNFISINENGINSKFMLFQKSKGIKKPQHF